LSNASVAEARRGEEVLRLTNAIASLDLEISQGANGANGANGILSPYLAERREPFCRTRRYRMPQRPAGGAGGRCPCPGTQPGGTTYGGCVGEDRHAITSATIQPTNVQPRKKLITTTDQTFGI
jgi:hypothetical protein